MHGHWSKTGPDRKHLEDNPQFYLRTKSKAQSMVWLLLDRHYVNTKEEPHIALHVYRGTRRLTHNGDALVHSVYLPHPPPSLRTNRTRRVLHPVLIGHAASFTPL